MIFWKIKSWLQMGLISLESSDMMGRTNLNDFVAFFCLNFFYQYFSFSVQYELKILELHSFFLQTAQGCSELHISCRTARWKKSPVAMARLSSNGDNTEPLSGFIHDAIAKQLGQLWIIHIANRDPLYQVERIAPPDGFTLNFSSHLRHASMSQ